MLEKLLAKLFDHTRKKIKIIYNDTYYYKDFPMKKFKNFISFFIITVCLCTACTSGYSTDTEKTESEIAREKTLAQFQNDIQNIKTSENNEIVLQGFLDLEGLVQLGTLIQDLTKNNTEPDFFISLDLSNIENISTIYPFTFRDCLALQEIILPLSIKKLDYFSFMGCTNLKKLSVENSELIIEAGAFVGCLNIDFSFAEVLNNYSYSDDTKILFNADKSVLYAYPAAQKNIETADLPASVTSIADYAFAYCENLESITLADTIQTVGKGIFKNCTNLTSCIIPQNVTQIATESFFNCEKLANIPLSNKIKAIEDYAFSACKSLANITLPENLEKLGKGVFADCESLTTITLPQNITNISDFLFQCCSNLTEVILPRSLEYIGNYAFAHCTKIENLALPQNLQEIANYAFYCCEALSSLTIPISLQKIGTNIISECSSCSYIFYLGTTSQWKTLLKTGSLGISVTVKSLVS